MWYIQTIWSDMQIFGGIYMTAGEKCACFVQEIFEDTLVPTKLNSKIAFSLPVVNNYFKLLFSKLFHANSLG